MKIHNLLVLDASGSMSTIYKQALDGVNSTIRTIRESRSATPDINQTFTLVSFNWSEDFLKTIYAYTPIEEVKDIKPSQYTPGGLTALYDALGNTLTQLEQQLDEPDTAALVTIITDGLENASLRYTADMIREIIERLSQKNVVFTYIGANQDVVLEAERMGIKNSLRYNSNPDETEEMFVQEGNSRRRFYADFSKNGGLNEEMRRDYFEHEHREPSSEGHTQIREVIDGCKVTPEHINQLKDNDVFVFGSNVAGNHGGGAAHVAVMKFGAVMGQGEGIQGQSYAIPTVGCSLYALKGAVERFINYAKAHPEKQFLVTAIGCGHGGYTPEEIAPLFAAERTIANITLPREFILCFRRKRRGFFGFFRR